MASLVNHHAKNALAFHRHFGGKAPEKPQEAPKKASRSPNPRREIERLLRLARAEYGPLRPPTALYAEREVHARKKRERELQEKIRAELRKAFPENPAPLRPKAPKPEKEERLWEDRGPRPATSWVDVLDTLNLGGKA